MTVVGEISRKVHYTTSGVEVTRVLRVVPYADFPIVAFLLMGGVRLLGGRLRRFPPARDPVLPWCFCQDVQVDGIGVFGSTIPAGITALIAQNGYEEGALLTAVYKTLENNPAPTDQQNQSTNSQQEIDIASETYDFSSQLLTISSNAMKWSQDGALLNNKLHNVTKVVPRVDFALTRHLVINKPSKAIRDMAGRINKSVLICQNDLYPVGTLRFDGASASRKTTSEGLKFWEMTYKFAVQPVFDDIVASFGSTVTTDYVTWNRLFRFDISRWDYPVFIGDANRRIYLYDEDGPSQVLGTDVVKGFPLLFHPAAS